MNALLYNTIIKPINMVSEKLFDFYFCLLYTDSSFTLVELPMHINTIPTLLLK